MATVSAVKELPCNFLPSANDSYFRYALCSMGYAVNPLVLNPLICENKKM